MRPLLLTLAGLACLTAVLLFWPDAQSGAPDNATTVVDGEPAGRLRTTTDAQGKRTAVDSTQNQPDRSTMLGPGL